MSQQPYRAPSSGRLRQRPIVGDDSKRPIFLTVTEAADFLRITPVTLGRWRIEGRGPRFAKFGRRVLYGRSDLIAWSEAQKRQSTSEPVHPPSAVTIAEPRSADWFRKHGWR
jgi:excisionase family DNA binding protein